MANEFKEIGKIEIAEDKSLVISEMASGEERKGIYINYHIKTEKYSGPTKGIMIYENDIETFKEIVAKL